MANNIINPPKYLGAVIAIVALVIVTAAVTFNITQANQKSTLSPQQAYMQQVQEALGTYQDGQAVTTDEESQFMQVGKLVCATLKDGATEGNLVGIAMTNGFSQDQGQQIVGAAHKYLCPDVK